MNSVNEERHRILQMVEQGHLSAAEAARLLDALSADPRPLERLQARLVRIRVTDLSSQRLKASVAIPVSLINVGLRLGARLAPQLQGSALEDLIRSVERGTTGLLLEWQDLEEGERIEIIVE
ncbi:hypothetical protein [Chloroflexus sp. Y-396-1]|jgi:hypothetical protein|uniref:SHOCT-like domain-containing protein n=1 Tax=Chloroflexus sp. Y-396-1 TaxID=867845 RepID=UPI00048C7073|nr:hypothetical protein [Chloroflexus sp. Y-396-1]